MKNKVEQIWDEFGCCLRKFIASKISNPYDADDILQEVFIKIHSGIDSLRDENKVRFWIFRIAQNAVIDHYRKKKLPLEDFNISNVVDENSDDEVSFFETIADNVQDEPTVEQEIASGLKDMIQTLPEKYAEALLLVEFQGLSQVQLADKLGITLSGAKSRVQRGRQMLKDSLMRCCHFEFDHYGTIICACPNTCCCCSSDNR